MELTQTVPARTRKRISARDLQLEVSAAERAATMDARELLLKLREAEFTKHAYALGMQQASADVSKENAAHAAWLVPNAAELGAAILQRVMSEVRHALLTILTEESVPLIEDRIRRLMSEAGNADLKLYCSSDDFQTVADVIERLRQDDFANVSTVVDVSLARGDMIVESAVGVIHASAAAFVETATNIIHQRVRKTLLAASAISSRPNATATSNRSANADYQSFRDKNTQQSYEMRFSTTEVARA
jgi:flagellar biosynthesis/type III secretory pathway protein FliH